MAEGQGPHVPWLRAPAWRIACAAVVAVGTAATSRGAETDAAGSAPENADAARGVLRARVAAALKTGKDIRAHLLVMGERTRVRLLRADGDSVVVRATRGGASVDATLAWKTVDDRALVACAWEALGPGDMDAALAALVLCRSAGIDETGNEAYARVLASGDEAARARATKIWKSEPAPPVPAGRAASGAKPPAGRRSAKRADDGAPAGAPTALEPGDRPALPEEIVPYDPPEMAAPAGPAEGGPPAFAEWTRTAEAGDVVVAAGDRLSALAGENAGRDAEVVVFGQSGTRKGVLARAEVVRWAEQGCAFRIPAGMPPEAMYLVWVRNRFGLSAPAVVNRTDAWWIGPDTVTRGATASVFGRNLALHPATHAGENASWVYFRPPAGRGAWCKVVAANPYKVDFVVPTGATNGTFEVWVHSGRGGAYGWSGPLAIAVEDDPGWTQAAVNVREMGAVGNGTVDDTAAIQKAVRAAQGRRGTAVFPAGTYLIGKALEPGSNVRWLGAGMDKTILKCSGGFPAGSPILGGGARNLEIRDLSLEAGPEPRRENSGINIRGATNIRFVNVRVMNHQGAGFDIQGDRRVFFQGCDVIGGSPSFMGGASQVFMDGCTFQGMYDANSLVASWGGTCISMTGCTGKDYDNTTPTGWGSGRFFVCMSHWGANRYQYFGGNASVDLCVRNAGDQNSGEQFLWELGTNWQGVPARATATTVTFDGMQGMNAGNEVAIVRGKGLGQNRRIAAVDAGTGTITVEPAWNVPPDATSLVVTGGFADRIVFYKNNIDGKPRGMKGTASCATNAYGCTFNMVADSNTCHETNGSFSNFGRIGGSLTSQTGSMVMPVYFSLYQNNRVETCSMGTINFLDSGGAAVGNPVLVLGAVSRRNTFVNVGAPSATYGRRGNAAAALLNVFDLNVTDRGALPLSVE